MSKSGSRYGRRSNWFKIHCLLQEQQQAHSANQNEMQKAPALSPNSFNLMRHQPYGSNLFSRSSCTKEELLMLRLDEYVKHPVPSSSPSVSSPDSHNSDSSIEIGIKRNSSNHKHVPNTQQHHNQQQISPLALSKDLFLPMQFAGFPLMPPPGFLPPTHFLYSSYHNALYEQNQYLMQKQVQQGLLKTSDSPLAFTAKSSSGVKKEHDGNMNNKEMDDFMDGEKCKGISKRDFVETEEEPQRRYVSTNSLVTRMIQKNHPSEDLDGKSDEYEDIEVNDSNEALTPPRSPNQIEVNNNPIDLSIKSGSSTKSDDLNRNYYEATADNISPSNSPFVNARSDCDSNDHKTKSMNGKADSCHDRLTNNKKHSHLDNESEEDDNRESNKMIVDGCSEIDEYERESKRRKSHSVAPLDLTTKV